MIKAGSAKARIKIINIVLFVVFAVLAAYFYVYPLQQGTGRYEAQQACPVCPATGKVEVMKDNYIPVYIAGSLSVVFLVTAYLLAPPKKK